MSKSGVRSEVGRCSLVRLQRSTCEYKKIQEIEDEKRELGAKTPEYIYSFPPLPPGYYYAMHESERLLWNILRPSFSLGCTPLSVHQTLPLLLETSIGCGTRSLKNP